MRRVQSNPLMYTECTAPAAMWYPGKSASDSTPQRCWQPVGGTWRQWNSECKPRCVDDGRDFVNSCVPHWSKDAAVRTRSGLEHELTWAYYRMRRHEQHPQRQAVGECLANEELPEKMRFGKQSLFRFWHDLRPPFQVLQAKRVDDGLSLDVPAAAVNHPDGELYNVTYACPIEYIAERVMDDKTANSTFDNKVIGVAQVRIPNGFPSKRPLHIVSWGQPTLNPPADLEFGLKPRAVEPEQWMPTACDVGVASNGDRATKAVKESKASAIRSNAQKKIVKVPELQRLLLGPHASLPRLAKMAAAQSKIDAVDAETPAAATAAGGVAPTRLRRHTVFTPAVGFVTYAG